jgi:hypothetical protein
MTTSVTTRDLRLDLFRGVALVMIFINHVPGNFASHWTHMNFGLSDAAEAFVFLSGFAAAIAYGPDFERGRHLLGAWRIAERAWTLYAFHLVLLMVVAGIVALAYLRLASPEYLEMIEIGPLFREPQVAVVMALTLQWMPKYLDILPLYVVLLLLLPAMLMLVRHGALAVIAPSLALYAGAHLLGLNLPAHRDPGGWHLNPFAWQLLFAIGVVCGHAWRSGRSAAPRHPALLWLAIAFLAGSLAARLSAGVLGEPHEWRFGIGLADKSRLGPLRVLHFLALSYVIAWMVPAGAAWLGSRWVRPLVLCGQASLPVFCLGTVLSVLGYVVLTEVGRGIRVEAPIVAGGILAMFALAQLLASVEKLRREARPPRLAPAA